ncbi:MAG: alkaline phosphatase family protein [Chthoniobacterales bacterium]|nr:alkaline phosphatase family protein [Chthoniobacterales bacterium]
MKKPKVVVIGLDAATWTLIQPWMAEGSMPNLARLMKGGAKGTLQSVLPPITPPAWTSFMTGKQPGKHGIFNFVESEPDGYAMNYANATSRRSPTVWKLLNDAGFTVGTMNIPFTYPPEKLNGFQISGMDTPSETSPFIHPRELKDELVKHLGHDLQLDLRFLGSMTNDVRRSQVLDEMREMDEQWSKVALYLLEKHPQDVMMFVFMSIDTVQHYFWQYMDKSHFLYDPPLAAKFGDAIRKVYERLDVVVGQIVDRLPAETAVFVVSDHGGGPVVDRTIYLNRYLAQLGLLHYKENATSGLRTLGQKVMRAGFSAIRSTLTSRQKVKLAALFPEMRRKSELAFSSFTAIDWSRTKAYCSEVLAAPPSIYINLKGVKPEGIVDPKDYDSLVNEIIAKIYALKDPRDGQPVIKKVWRREEIFHGPFAEETADLILDWWNENSLFSTSPSFPEDTDQPALVIREHKASETSEWGGTHRLFGILVARSPVINPNMEVQSPRLIDISPTILHLLGVPVPEDMDGRVLESIFKPEFLRAHPLRSGAASGTSEMEQNSGYTDEESAKVEERLQALGYLE